MNGIFVISLDFELHWGVRDKRSVKEYKKNLLGARVAIPKILELFQKYEIHSTWATVGLLIVENKDELFEILPEKKPSYNNANISPYIEIEKQIGYNEKDDPFHYAKSLISEITKYKGQEIGSHTFSHYYCLEKGQTKEHFKQDLMAFARITKRNNIEVKSIILPRNQINTKYNELLLESGFLCFRGNPLIWPYFAKNEKETTVISRIARILDSYVNLFGHNCYDISDMSNESLINIKSSRFLRAYSKVFRNFESIKIKRIKDDLEYAAKNNLIYHLWWHPHNFGVNIEENLKLLDEILFFYKKLNKDYNFTSMNMGELAEQILSKRT